jgi:hypothetical protein
MGEQARFVKGEAGRMRFMFETGLRGVEGKPVGLEKLPRRALWKDEGQVFLASKASSALAISCLR